jgi:hypothetical protein
MNAARYYAVPSAAIPARPVVLSADATIPRRKRFRGGRMAIYKLD